MNAVGTSRPGPLRSDSAPTSIAVGSCQLGPPNPSAPTRTVRAGSAASEPSSPSSPSSCAIATSSVGCGRRQLSGSTWTSSRTDSAKWSAAASTAWMSGASSATSAFGLLDQLGDPRFLLLAGEVDVAGRRRDGLRAFVRPLVVSLGLGLEQERPDTVLLELVGLLGVAGRGALGRGRALVREQLVGRVGGAGPLGRNVLGRGFGVVVLRLRLERHRRATGTTPARPRSPAAGRRGGSSRRGPGPWLRTTRASRRPGSGRRTCRGPRRGPRLRPRPRRQATLRSP